MGFSVARLDPVWASVDDQAHGGREDLELAWYTEGGQPLPGAKADEFGKLGLLQESRLKAWRALATYESRASFRAWMYRIVTNTCLDMLEARSRRVLPQDVSPSIVPAPMSTSTE